MDKLKEAAERAAQQLKDKVAEKMAKTPLEKALHEATADVNWNASNKVLQEVADHTYSFGDFTEVMKHIWKRVSADKKQWRRTLKSLTLIEYLIKNGSPRCVQEFKDEIYQIRALKDFALYEEGQDRGAAIREKSKIIVDLLNDEQKIEEERQKAQELKGRIGDMSGYGSRTNKYSGSSSSYSSSSNRYDNYSNKDKGKLTGYGSESQNYRGDRGGGYDDTRKAGSWRVEKNDEPSHKKREPETDNNGDYVVKSGTKYDISMINKQESDEKPVEKPKATIKPGTKTLAPPKGGNAAPVQQQEVNFLDMDAPATTTQPATTQSADPFNWNEPQSQPQQKAQTQAQPQNTWDWNQTGPGNTQQNTANNNNQQGFNWNQAQTAQPQPAQTNIQNLYQQQQPSNQFGFQQQQGQFGFNNAAPQGNAFQQQPMNNLASQMGQLSFNATPNTGMQTSTNNANQFNFGNAPASTSPAKDGFDDFQSAKPATTGNEYKNYSQNEKSIIDLSDLSSEMNKKQDIKEKINASKHTNDGFLYSSKDELDNFFVPPQPLNNMGNMGGMQGGMNNMGGFNQGMRNMGGMQQMGGMGQMGGMQQMGGMGQMGGMNMGYGNMGGNPNMGGFNPMMGGNQQGNFGGQMGYGFGGR